MSIQNYLVAKPKKFEFFIIPTMQLPNYYYYYCNYYYLVVVILFCMLASTIYNCIILF